MYLLKHFPEDFIVAEVAEYPLTETGPFLLVKATKRERNTEDVARELARQLRVPRQLVGFAGLKDKRAVTTQYFSVKGKTKEDLEGLSIENVSLDFVGYTGESLALGMLRGNRFTLTIRNLAGDEDLSLPKFIPNYFDEQRFAFKNARIGEMLVRKEFAAACQVIMEDRQHRKRVAEHLEEKPNDFVGAVRLLPVPLLKIYLHAFQSRLWNETLVRYVENHARAIVRRSYSQGGLAFPINTFAIENKQIPLPGFGNEEADPEIQKYIDDILRMNGLAPRDFVIKQLPNLSQEGALRPALMEVEEYEVGEFEEDEEFPGMKKATLSFRLAKGSYATMLVKALFCCGADAARPSQ